MLEFVTFCEKFPTFYPSVIVWESAPEAKGCGQPIWLKLDREVGCDEIFQKPLWLTSLTFSFGVTWLFWEGGGLFFCPLSTKNLAFQGAFWKCHNNPTGKLCSQMSLTMNSSIIELSVNACNFVVEVLHREEPRARVWPKLMLKLHLKIAIIFTCLLALLPYL